MHCLSKFAVAATMWQGADARMLRKMQMDQKKKMGLHAPTACDNTTDGLGKENVSNKNKIGATSAMVFSSEQNANCKADFIMLLEANKCKTTNGDFHTGFSTGAKTCLADNTCCIPVWTMKSLNSAMCKTLNGSDKDAKQYRTKKSSVKLTKTGKVKDCSNDSDETALDNDGLKDSLSCCVKDKDGGDDDKKSCKSCKSR